MKQGDEQPRDEEAAAMNDDYEVGYGRPPKHSQFRPGQSGNPAGRRKGKQAQSRRATIFRKVASEAITLQTNYGSQQITRCEALLRRLAAMELGGDRGASRLLHQLRKLYPGRCPQAESMVFIISEADSRL